MYFSLPPSPPVRPSLKENNPENLLMFFWHIDKGKATQQGLLEKE